MATFWQTALSYFQRAPTQRTTGLTAAELFAIIDAQTQAGGITVSASTALNLSAVWCAVQNISGTVGKLPLILYKRRPDDGGRDKYIEHSLYRLLHDEPNAEMGAMVFRETIQAHVLLWGNGYAEIVRDRGGRVSALEVITPDRVTMRRDTRGGLYYEVQNPTGSSSRLASSAILHIRGPSYDGITGYSVIGKARSTLTLGMQTEKFGTSLFSNGPKWPGALEHPKGMSPAAKAAMRADLRSLAPGDYPMFEEGIKWVSTGMPAKDAEFLATRQFQVEEIARWFNMPPHKLKDLMRATFSNIEHQGIDYLTDTIDPWLVKWEEEINRKVIAPLENRIQYAEFMREALQQADLAAKNASFTNAIQWGYMSRDEVRAKLNMNPIPNGEGEVFLVPANMLPADKLGDVADLPMLEDVEPGAPALQAPKPDRALAPAPAEPDMLPEFVPAIIAGTNGHAHAETRVEEPAPTMPPAPPPLPRLSPRVITAQRKVFADVVRRMLAREKDKATTVATHGPDRLRTWIGDFYGKYADVFAFQLLPIMQMHLALTGSDRDPEQATRALVAAHVEESRRQLHALLDAQPADLVAEVESLLARWDIERVNVIPDLVMQEELSHADAHAG